MAFARIISALLRSAPFDVYGSGQQSRDFTYIGDAVEATIAAMESGLANTVYNVGGGSETTLRDVIALAQRLAGRRLEVRYEATAAGDVRRTAADTTRIRSELGWSPQTALADGLRQQLAATQNELDSAARS
jgi:nucleoside-diphosphate-sugar epimerase